MGELYMKFRSALQLLTIALTLAFFELFTSTEAIADNCLFVEDGIELCLKSNYDVYKIDPNVTDYNPLLDPFKKTICEHPNPPAPGYPCGPDDGCICHEVWTNPHIFNDGNYRRYQHNGPQIATHVIAEKSLPILPGSINFNADIMTTKLPNNGDFEIILQLENEFGGVLNYNRIPNTVLRSELNLLRNYSVNSTTSGNNVIFKVIAKSRVPMSSSSLERVVRMYHFELLYYK